MFGFGKNKEQSNTTMPEQTTNTVNTTTVAQPVQQPVQQQTQVVQQQTQATQQPTMTTTQTVVNRVAPQVVQPETTQPATAPVEEVATETVEEVEETKPVKKKKEGDSFFRTAFTRFLPIALCVIALGLMMFAKFLFLVTARGVSGWFNFFAWGSAIAALIIEAIRQIKVEKLEVNSSMLVCLLSNFILAMASFGY